MNQFRPSLRSGVVLSVVCALLVSGCAGMNPDAREILQQPPECGQSTEQLEASHGSGLWRLGQGLQAILPPMILLSVLRDSFIGKPYRSVYLDHWRVAFGSYNRKIDARVDYLQACGE